jgi:hypothetical protein
VNPFNWILSSPRLSLPSSGEDTTTSDKEACWGTGSNFSLVMVSLFKAHSKEKHQIQLEYFLCYSIYEEDFEKSKEEYQDWEKNGNTIKNCQKE